MIDQIYYECMISADFGISVCSLTYIIQKEGGRSTKGKFLCPFIILFIVYGVKRMSGGIKGDQILVLLIEI